MEDNIGEDKTMIAVKVENIVASTAIAEELDLAMIDAWLSNTKADSSYQPDEFPGLVLHLYQPKLTFLLFTSGRVVCTGTKNIENIQTGLEEIIDLLEEAGAPVIDEPAVIVNNIVASANLGMPFNLYKLAVTLGLENVEYEPEVFPGLVYRVEDLAVILLFSTGNLICTGTTTPKEASQAVNRLQDELQQKGLLG